MSEVRQVEHVHLSPNQRAWRRFKSNRIAAVSGALLIALVLIVMAGPILSRPTIRNYVPAALAQSPLALSDLQFGAPSGEHWLGTDVHGRDLLSRVLYGARISLLVGIVGAGVSLVIGVLWGALAGYLAGRWDSIMMRIVDILYTVPSIIFVILLISAWEAVLKDQMARAFSAEMVARARLIFLFVGLGAVSWLTMARIVRGEVLSLRTRNFIDASRALGASHARILFRHILPNVSGVIIVYLTLTVPSIVLHESFLSYLGLGIQPPQASLGSLIAEGAAQINPIRVYWWMIIPPCGFLAATLLALNFVGDGLRDAFDARLESR
ncbi:MAG: ABC transporter permease [Verrucomicrobia bacterium]|nr:ABC transporter permease [Verrucomicrobiota bacterium]